MPYQLYTQEHLEPVYATTFNASAYIDDDDVKHFTNNIDKWECRGEENQFKEFDRLKHSSKHCEMYSHVLRLGYETLRGWMLEYNGLDIDNYITIQS